MVEVVLVNNPGILLRTLQLVYVVAVVAVDFSCTRDEALGHGASWAEMLPVTDWENWKIRGDSIHQPLVTQPSQRHYPEALEWGRCRTVESRVECADA